MLRKFFLLLLILTQSIVFAQTPVQKLEQAFKILLNDPQAKYAITSLCVLDGNTGKQVFGRNEHMGLATASTLKTITSATALSLLGKDFRYQTTLAYSGVIDAGGTLKGNLIIVGGGDPTLGSTRYETTKETYILNQWITAIKAAGIRRIEGSIIGDDGLWGSQTIPDGWIWQDIGNYYGAGATALSWRENQFDIYLKAERSTVTVLKTVPAMPYLKIVNELKPGAAGTGDRAYAYLPPLSNIAYLRGTWAIGITKTNISAALPDPSFEAAFALQQTLQQNGIAVSAAATTTRQLAAAQLSVPEIAGKLLTLNSPSLSQIVYWFNKKSVNLYGEHLLKTLAWKAGKEASTKNGAKIVVDYWAGKGLDKAALNILDGSGLSPGTRVTTAAMASVLFQAQQESWFPSFYESLPENNGMKLKSGTINDVSAFAGYYTDRSGRKYVIVININNYSGSGINAKLFNTLDALK